MKLLDRYIIRQMAVNFLLIVAALAALYLLVDIFERFGAFRERNLPNALAVRYFALKLTRIIDEIAPVSLLLSGILTLGLMMNRRELQSLNAGGIAKMRVMVPFGIGALICITLALAASQWLLPVAGSESRRIWRLEVEGERGAGTVRKGVTFFRGQKGIYAFTDPRKDHKVLINFRYQEFDSNAGSGIAIYAKKATFNKGLWSLQNGQIRTGGGQGKVEPFLKKTIALPDAATTFFAPVPLAFEKPIASLVLLAMDREQPGHFQAVLDLNRRLSFLFLGLPLLCLALPVILCFELGRTSINLAFAIPVSAGIAFLVWGVWSGLQAMAQAAALSTVVASWSIHFLCVVAGAIIMAKRR